MISASKFYSSKNPSRYTTLVGARSHAESRYIRNIVVLPPDSSNLDIASDTEEYPELFAEDGGDAPSCWLLGWAGLLVAELMLLVAYWNC